MICHTHVPLTRLTSFQLSGTLPELFCFNDVDDLLKFISHRRPFCVLGKGSNMLLDPNIPECDVIRIDADIVDVDITANHVIIPAGFTVNQIMALCQDRALSGLEFCAGVPASFGGMVAMNFGCWGRSVSDIITRVLIVNDDAELQWVRANDMVFSYRSSIIQSQPWVVVAAEVALSSSDSSVVKDTVRSMIRRRIEKQPLGKPTFGSMFKNPKGDYAARLIESAGWKGRRVGSVGISDQHANFMVNDGDASIDDAIHLLQDVEASVRQMHGVRLEREVCIRQ